MRNKLLRGIQLFYILLLTINIFLVVKGDLLFHYWKFNFESKILYIGVTKISQSQVNYLFIIWVTMYLIGLLYLAILENYNLKRTVYISCILSAGMMFFPKILILIISGPTILLHRLISSLQFGLIQTIIIIIAVTVQATIIHYFFNNKKQHNNEND